MVELAKYSEARDGLRHRDLRQALYDEGHRLMGDVIVNLHGQEHIDRRRLENRLFRRDTFAWYEQEHIPTIIERTLSPAIAAGSGELLDLARRTMIRLSVDVAGVEVLDASFGRFYELMNRLARASTVNHAVGDKQAIIDDGDAALAAFEIEFYRASRVRRLELAQAVERGEADARQLPRDVLTTLLVNQDQLELPEAVVLRETAYYPWVGSHSTSAQLVHALHHMFEWLAERPEDQDRLVNDELWRQRFVHESMRLHPASPVAVRTATCGIELKSGRRIEAGTHVTIDVEAANRDPSVFGPHANDFHPMRPLADDVTPWGLSFGSGTHACVGRELAGGTAPGDVPDQHLSGAVSMMAGALLAAGARPNPRDPATQDVETTRTMWGRYPVTFASPEAERMGSKKTP